MSINNLKRYVINEVCISFCKFIFASINLHLKITYNENKFEIKQLEHLLNYLLILHGSGKGVRFFFNVGLFLYNLKYAKSLS